MIKNATSLLHNLIENLIQALDELGDISDTPTTEFAYGEKTAYVECLEWISEWDEAEAHGLDFDVETKFPL